MDMDMKLFGILYICFAILVVSVTIIIRVYDTNQNALASQDALNQCHSQGFNSYVDFQRIWLSSNAIGVRCEQPINNYNIKLNNLNGNP